MKKNYALFVLVFVLLCPVLQAADGARQEVNAYGWTLLGADAALCAGTVIAVVNAGNAVDDYNSLKKEIDNTTDANYYRLMYEKEKADNKNSIAVVIGIATGAALAYTALDYLRLHEAFPEVKVQTGYNPQSGEYSLVLKKAF
jgi:hypothetical protein